MLRAKKNAESKFGLKSFASCVAIDFSVCLSVIERSERE